MSDGLGEDILPSAPFSFVAIFNPDSCTLSGAAVFFDFKVMDVFVWDVLEDDDEMSGDYVGSTNGAVAWSRFGQHEVRPRGRG